MATDTKHDVCLPTREDPKERDPSCRWGYCFGRQILPILIVAAAAAVAAAAMTSAVVCCCRHHSHCTYSFWPTLWNRNPATSLRANNTSNSNSNSNSNPSRIRHPQTVTTGGSYAYAYSYAYAWNDSDKSTMRRFNKDYVPRRCETNDTIGTDGYHRTHSNGGYEAPEPFEYLHDCCDDCNPFVEESPDPLVSMTWNQKKDTIENSNIDTDKGPHHGDDPNSNPNETFVGVPLQIYRTRTPVNIWTIPSDGCLRTRTTETNKAKEAATTRRQTLSRNANPPPPPPPAAAAAAAPPAPNTMTIVSDCTIVMDWGSERAAWFELLSRDDLTRDNPTVRVRASISEYNRPYPGKTRELTKHGNRTYRLETNDELYEGVRFTFLHVEFLDLDLDLDSESSSESSSESPSESDTTLTIDDVSIVSKIKPVEYTGSFRSSNPLLTKAYYWGAYGVRLNIEQSQLNSILIERGDRVAIQGDGHPTIATVLQVFYGHETRHLVKNVLAATDSAHKRVVDDVIMAYPLYWCLSAMDYYWATYTGGEGAEDSGFVRNGLVNDISLLLDQRIKDFLDPELDITWFGWDDRVGNGWCFHSKQDACTREGLLSFAGLVIRVCNDFVHLLESLVQDQPGPRDGQIASMIERYRNESKRMTQALRRVPEFPAGFGVHSAANAINALVATPEEIKQHWMGTTDGTTTKNNNNNNNNTLNNAATICSFSQFNQYWILQAYGTMEGGLEHALKSIELCWGPMMELSTGGCFWEMSSPEWLRFMSEGDQAPHLPSYCHPWASGVTPWLSKLLGGLNPLKPGYEEFIAMPYVSGNYRSVSTTTATPHGPISVAARLTSCDRTARNNDESLSVPSFQLEATIRANVSGMFGIRRTLVSESDTDPSLDMQSIVVNGIPVTANNIIDVERATLLLGHLGSQRVREHVFVVLDEKMGNAIHAGGVFTISTTYDHALHHIRGDVVEAGDGDPESIGERNEVAGAESDSQHHSSLSTTNPFSPFPLPSYPATIDQPFDRDSKGDGLLVHGKDGYILLGCNATDKLPPYVESVKVRQHGYPGWVIPDEELVGYSDTDPLYLPLGEGQNTARGKRVLGRLGIEDSGGGDINCILVDVTVADGATPCAYALSLYLVATRTENRHAIRVMDGDTLDVIAPTTVVEDYQGGVWWTVHYDRSVRLKMMDIEGIHVSAIAFAANRESVEVVASSE